MGQQKRKAGKDKGGQVPPVPTLDLSPLANGEAMEHDKGTRA
jgi:hypothetical protein